MLTLELLKSSLQGLSDEQLNAIVTLSKNDEDTVVGTKFAALHNELDEMVKSITGKGKDTNEKTSEYIKRMLGEQKQSVVTLEEKVKGLETTKSELESRIASGSGDKELIAGQKATIDDLTNKYNILKGESDKMKAEHAKALADMRISTELSSAMAGIAFKGDANQEVLGVLKQNAMNAVKGMNPSYITDDKGAEVLIFRDTNGAEMRNPDNMLRHYTAKELLAKELSKYGVVEEGTRTGGTGGTPPLPKPRTDISGAKTKTEVMDVIANQVAASGFVRGTNEYQAEVDRIYEENLETINTLPTR